jgi:hypothetical protein
LLTYLGRLSPFLRLLDDKTRYEYGASKQVEAIIVFSEVDLEPQDVPGETEEKHQDHQSSLGASEI